jgi:hypothetical protein
MRNKEAKGRSTGKSSADALPQAPSPKAALRWSGWDSDPRRREKQAKASKAFPKELG